MLTPLGTTGTLIELLARQTQVEVVAAQLIHAPSASPLSHGGLELYRISSCVIFVLLRHTILLLANLLEVEPFVLVGQAPIVPKMQEK